MKSAIFAAIFLMMATSAFAGRITAWGDPDVFYPNSGKISYMDLYFSLDTKLPAGHVMRITLPFSISPTITSTLVYAGGSGVTKGTWYAGSSSLTTNSSTFTATGTTKLQGSSSPFNNYFWFSADLAAATNYVIRITFTSSPTDVGFLGYIQMETMSPATSVTTSSGSDSAISYDLNNAFAPLHIMAAPGNISTYTITSDSNSLVGGQSSVRQLAFVPTQTFFYWPLIQLSWDNTNFTISNLTSIDIGTNSSANTTLTSSGTTATSTAGYFYYSNTSTVLSIYHNAQLFTNQTVKYNFTTANPSGSSSSTINFNIKIMHRWNFNLTDVSSSAIAFTVAATTTSSSSSNSINVYNILLSWGIDPQASTLTSNTALARVFTLYTTATTNPIYQAVRFVFGIATALSSGTYQVTVQICAANASCDVLENSIVSNMTGQVCWYTWAQTNRQIACNATAIATTGNSIGGRIWLLGGTTSGNYGLLQSTATTTSFQTTFSDSTFGTISITQPGVTSFTTISTTLNSSYNSAQFNWAPLVNINGNGPMAAVTSNSSINAMDSAPTAYPSVWSSTSTGINPTTSSTVYAGYYAGPASSASAQAPMGGIFATTTAAQKYNVALYTSATAIALDSSSRVTFSNVGTAISAIMGGIPGIDLFFNPNLWTNAAGSTGASIISSCWANNAPYKLTTDFYSNLATDAITHMGAHCYSSGVTTTPSYTRLRMILTSASATYGTLAAAASSKVSATGFDSVLSTKNFLTFFWENAVTLTSAWGGASLKADSYVGDYYGVMYSLANGSTPAFPVKTGAASTTTSPDIGELGATMTLAATTANAAGTLTYTLGTPFMWTQMIMGPYAPALTGAVNTGYYKQKAVFISGYTGLSGTAESTLNSNSVIQTLRVRGSLATADASLYPSSGKIAIFLMIPTTLSSWEPLAGVNFTNSAYTVGSYNSQTYNGPLVGSGGAFRCWNAGSIGNCLLDRYGRALPFATPFAASGNTAGTTSAIDLYEILTSDAAYTSNFSIAFLVKPKVTSTYTGYYFRFGFQATNGSYYVQSWDQFFDNSATISSNLITTLGGTFTGSLGSTTVAYPTSGTSCVLPYTAGTTTAAPAVRIVPNSGDLDNNVTASAITLNINQGASALTSAITATSKQGQVTWCVQWNFKQSSSFALNSTALENSTLGDKCVAFDFLSAESSAQSLYCIWCPNSNTGINAYNGAAVQVTLTSFYDGPAVNIPTYVYGGLTNDVGALLENSYCNGIIASTSTLWTAQTMTVTSPSSSFNINSQKVTIPFTAPSTLTNTDTIQLVGKNQSANAADTSFPYGSLDSAVLCKLVPNSAADVSTWVGCTATNSSGVITINGYTIPTASQSVTSWTLLLWGLNGNTASSSSPSTTYFVMQTYKTNSSFIVDQSSTTNTSFISWALSNLTNSSFGTANTLYQRAFVGARGWFRFDIVFGTRTWLYNDKVVINLDAVISTTVNNLTSVVKCRITDTSDALLQIFQSCTLSVSSLSTLTIVAMTPATTKYTYDFSASTGIRVYLDNMVTLTAQTNKTIYGTITFVGSGSGSTTALTRLGNASTTDIAPTTLSTTAFASSAVNITKWWYNANDFQDLTFSILTSGAFNSSCRLTIAFPSYYNPGLTTRSTTPYCTIGGTYTQCVVGSVTSAGVITLSQGLRSLVVYGYSGSIAANGTILLRVNGISAPPASYTAETFWVQINGDNTESSSTLMNGGAVTDASYSAPSTAVAPVNVVWFTVSSTATRTFSTFTWTFGLNTTIGIVNTSQAIQAVFPESWGMAWGEFAPTCTVYDFVNNSLIYASSQSMYGNLIQLNVSTAIPAGDVVTLSCTNVRAANSDSTYRSQDITVRVVDANGTLVYQRSAPGAHNVNFAMAFAKNSSQTYTAWSQTSSAASPLALTAGTYSLLLTLTVSSMSSRSFFVTPSNSNFAFLSSTAPFWLVWGATSNSTYLGCSGSVPVGLYNLYFTISDNSSTYIAPSILWVGVTSNTKTITPSSSTLSAYYSSSSLSSTAPLYFDLSTMAPYSDVTITPVAPTGNTNFTFSPSSIKLTPAAPKNFFIFTSTSAATVAASAAYTFTLSGTNSASYSLSSSVTVSLTTDSGTGTVNTPVVAISADSSDTSAATSKIITFTLSSVTQATVYWVVTLQGQSITDATAIWMNAAAMTSYNMNSANQAQYSTSYVVSTTKTSYTISNLFPNTGYTVSAVAVSNTNKTSTVATYTFVTGVNAASIQRWIFNYTTYPSQAQRQTLLCQITQILAVPAINVRDVNGEICGNTTAFYSTSNSTGDIGIYFYPLQATTDTTMTSLQTLLNTTTIMGSLNTTLSAGTSGLGFYNAWVDYASIKNLAPSLTLPTSLPSTVLTSASVYVSFTVTNDTGFAFIALCSNSSTTTPTAVQIKQAAANISTLTGQQSVQVFYFYPGATVSYNFTGLSAATSYNVYMVASNNDPSFLQNFTSVQAVSITTPSISSTTGSPIGVIFSVMAVFASVISLMFF